MAGNHTEELIVGLYDLGEIVYMPPPGSGDVVKDPDYPEEVFKPLKSGRLSPHYIGGRDFTGFSKDLALPIDQQRRVRDVAVNTLCGLVEDQAYDHLLGIPEAMTGLTGMVAHENGDSFLWIRVGDKKYGMHKPIQGFFAEGDTVASLDNVIADGASKIETAESLKAAGLQPRIYNVLVDREEGGREAMEAAGYQFAAVVGMSAINRILAENRRITPQQLGWAEEYIRRMTAG